MVIVALIVTVKVYYYSSRTCLAGGSAQSLDSRRCSVLAAQASASSSAAGTLHSDQLYYN
jgi:hypothetical protein